MKPGVTFDPCACGIHRDDCNIHSIGENTLLPVDYKTALGSFTKTCWIPIAGQTIFTGRNPIKSDRAKHPESYKTCTCHEKYRTKLLNLDGSEAS